MKVLSFDPGEKAIGYAVVEKFSNLINTLNVIETGKFDITGAQDRCQKEINKLLSFHKPDYVAYEKSGAFLNSVYNKILDESCSKSLIPSMGCNVSDVRDFVYNDKHISKAESIHILKNNILVFKNVISNDEYDAISIGFFALRIKLVKSQEESS